MRKLILVAAIGGFAGTGVATGVARAQTVEETYAALCGKGQQSETCDTLARAIHDRQATAIPEASLDTPPPDPVRTARGTKEDPIPLPLGQKHSGRLDKNSPGAWGTHVVYYRLLGMKGQTVVAGLDCDVSEFYSCYYTGVDPEKNWAYQVELADAPKGKAFRFTLKMDNPLLEVWTNGTVDYTIVVQDGLAGEALWAETKAARGRYDQAIAREKAERSVDRAELFGAVVQGLAQGTAEAHVQNQALQQSMDDAVVRGIAQGNAIRAQREADEARYEIERPVAVQQQSGNSAQGLEGRSDSGSPSQAEQTGESAAAASKSLQFVLMISMRNLPGDTHNSMCYSNVITRPGPPGWGAPGFLPSGSAEQALREVSALKGEFIAACRRSSGREITSEGNFSHIRNQHDGDEQRMRTTQPRVAEDVAVVLD